MPFRQDRPERVAIISLMFASSAIAFFMLLGLWVTLADAKHDIPERIYQTYWCDSQGGRLEVSLDDGARVDCLTERYAVEFDFASKWAESVGQSLYYSIKTGKRPVVVLIMENGKDEVHLKRLQAAADQYGIMVIPFDRGGITK